jgi:cellulose synthase (UDP-forming)
MNPKLLLSLWRERWGKPSSNELMMPYRWSKVNHWAVELATAPQWGLPGASIAVLLASIAVLALAIPMQFSLGGQVVYSLLFVGVSVFARKFPGTQITLIMLTGSAFLSLRYLYWRADQTIHQLYGSDFALALCLIALEIAMWLAITVPAIRQMWPIATPAAPIPNDSNDWPTVDIVIMAHGRAPADVGLTVSHALAQDWPVAKFTVRILDAAPREEIEMLAANAQVTYVAEPERRLERAASINQTIGACTGELLLVVEAGQVPGKDFLQTVGPWFLQNSDIGMLQTPRHFLAPEPESQYVLPPKEGGDDLSVAMFRLSALREIGGVQESLPLKRSHTALHLQHTGFSHSYIYLSADDVSKVDGPFLGKTVAVKETVQNIEGVLDTFSPAIHAFLMAVPIVCLVAGKRPVFADLEFFCAYAIPHLLALLLLREKIQSPAYLPLNDAIVETMKGWVVLLRTFSSLFWTELRRIGLLVRGSRESGLAPLDLNGMSFTVFLLISAAHIAALSIGATRVVQTLNMEDPLLPLYFLWVIVSLLLLMGSLAVAQESRHVSLQYLQKRQIRAMLKLSTGKSVYCTTENFPSFELELRLPSSVVIHPDTDVTVSFFRAHHEFVMGASVSSMQDQTMRLTIDEASRADYQMLGAAVFSRGKDWPKWLPDQYADRLLPGWAENIVIRAEFQFMKLAHSLNMIGLVEQIGRWAQRWNQKR